ncbi:beta-lactamase family protein [Altererythrobacter sp. SALINAS58]|uniref:serine hydrolase domain-containing protein n=1 Tax=Alteripontixanthobacter muriae TaxID=2705546 RepID=UPI001575BDFF|nr:serine hydrolase domain-containing protein [Alteripontixanthobacter muriae]NTZ43275.1 beta-lactamase family protein [Alteripontixanthobacter muriae]
MRFIQKIILVLAALATLPLAAQVPAPGGAPAAQQRAGSAAPATDAAARELTRQDVEAWLDGFLPYALNKGRIAGAVVVVVEDDEVVLQKGYGYADVDSRQPVTAEGTLFRPGSVSKLFTWTAVMQQVEEGNLDLDADVNQYLDFEIPPFEGEPITLRDIMTHTAGFEESIRYLITDDPDAIMSLGEQMPLALPERVFAPGTTPAYSNYATALAGYIVERASGMNFDDYIDQRIFTPLNMTRSTFRQPLPARLEPLMSSGYSVSTEDAKAFEIVVPAPAGSLSATGADMAKFMMAHLNEGGPLLQPSTARTMHNYRAPGVGPLNTMALGFYEQQVNGRRAIAHGGDTQWFHSYLWLFPQDDVGIFIAMNSAGIEGASGAIRSSLFHAFADRYLPGEVPQTRVEEQTAREHAAMIAGNYISSRGSFTNFMRLIGLLGPLEIVVDADGQIALPALDGLSAAARDWVEVEPFVWRDTATGERLAAEVEDGRVVRVSTDAISPFMVLEPAPAAYNAAWLLPALLAALVLVFLAAIAWPVRARVRRNYGAKFALEDRSLLAWRLSRAFAWLTVAAVVGWVVLIIAFSSDLGSVGGPLDWLINLLRFLTPIATLGLLITAAWHLWLSFRVKRPWTMKIGAILLLLSALVLVWVTFGYNLYGFRMVY